MSRQQATNRELAQDTARANLLTNGGFEIWQRGGGPFTSGYSADRWVLYAPVGTFGCSQGAAPNTDGSRYSLYASPTAGLAGLYQVIEDWQALAGRTISMSIRVRPSVVGMFRFGFSPDKASTLPTLWSNYNVGGSSTWETVMHTYAVPGSATGLTLWLITTLAGTIVLDNAMLVVGSVAADYAPLHPADDLARCQRYYEIIGGGTTLIFSGYAGAASQTFYYSTPYKVVKPVMPTITKLGNWTSVGPANAACDAIDYSMCRWAVVNTAAGPFYTNPQPIGFAVEANP